MYLFFGVHQLICAVILQTLNKHPLLEVSELEQQAALFLPV